MRFFPIRGTLLGILSLKWQDSDNLPDSSQATDVEIASVFLCHPLFVAWRASVFIGERKFCIRCSIMGKHTLFHGYVQCTKAQNCCWSTNFSIFAQPINIRKAEGKLVWAFLTEKVFTNRTIPVKSCFRNYEMWGVTRCVSYTQLRYYFRLKRVNYLLESESLTAQDTSRHLLVKVSLLKLNCTTKLWT